MKGSDQLRGGLARLDEAEILFVRGEPPQSSYNHRLTWGK
jgi:hypothetical protein